MFSLKIFYPKFDLGCFENQAPG